MQTERKLQCAPDLLRDLTLGNVDQGEIARNILAVWNGVDGLVQELRKSFDALPDGHRDKIGILKMIFGYVQEHAVIAAEADALADEDLIVAVEKVQLLLTNELTRDTDDFVCENDRTCPVATGDRGEDAEAGTLEVDCAPVRETDSRIDETES